MGSSSHFPVEDKLREKSNYHGWKMSLNLTLEEQEVLDHVRGGVVEPPSNASTTARNKWTKGEFKAKKIIRDPIDKCLVAYVSELNTSKEIYDRLVRIKVNDSNQVLFLRNKLKEIKKGKDENMQAYFLRITEIKNDLLSIGEVIPDREMALTTLGGLPSEWYIFKNTLLNNNIILGFEELMARCIQEEARMEEHEMPTVKGHLAAFSSHGHYARKCPDKRNSHRDDDQNPSQGNQRNGRSNGRGKRSDGNQGRGQPFKKARNSRYESNIVDNKLDEYYLPVALSTSTPPDSLGNWLIDSGASRHFTGYKEALHNLIEKETNLEIVLGDNMKYLVKGVGNVSLKLNQGNTIHLQDVLYVPDLKKSLVSISAMEDKGYKVGGSLLGVMFCDTSLQSKLWHQRFAHLHYKALPDVRKMVTGMPEFKSEHEGVRPRCAKGKLKRGPFPSSQSKTSDILQLVHSDIFGMMPVNSLGGYSYYLTFIDDYSRKTWIYFLKKKDEVFFLFRHLQALIENQIEKKIKILRTDNGIEYESNEFHDFCNEAGIKRETTTPYTPEHNGVVERKNHTIVKAFRAMLHDQRLPKFLWVEAANTAVYVQNRCPHQALGSKTPEEVFTSKKPDVSCFRIFGSPVYFHVPKEKRNKLGASRKKGIFVGYSENTKGYRIYVADQKEVVIIHDVTFDEDMALSKVNNLPTMRSSQEADTKEPK
eukprot:PITA_14766